jgi:hypothetical protein
MPETATGCLPTLETILVSEANWFVPETAQEWLPTTPNHLASQGY